MPRFTMMKAWLVGFAITFLAYAGLYFDGITHLIKITAAAWLIPFAGILSLGWYPGIFAAGFVAAMLAPREKFLAGASLTIAGAVLAVVFNVVLDVFGHRTDLHGLWGAVIVFIATFLIGGIICGLGAFFGAELSEYLENRKRRRQRT